MCVCINVCGPTTLYYDTRPEPALPVFPLGTITHYQEVANQITRLHYSVTLYYDAIVIVLYCIVVYIIMYNMIQ